MTTLYATYRVPGDGVTTQFEFSFSGGYMDKSHVKAYIEDAVTLARTPIEVLPTMFVGDFTLNLGVAAPVGKNMVIYRDTPKSGPLVDFTTGSRLTEANLDKVAQQSVFIGAETADATNADVVAQLTTTAQAVLDAADEATASAAAAQASEVSADTSEANALASANNAAASAASIIGAVASSAANAGAAAASATVATTKAAEASASASTADTRATAAAGSANAAAASATAAAGSASTASAQATAAASSATASASSATSASASAATATTQATNAGNSASAAAVSASSASASATTATTQAGVATTQAGIATTQAGNASASATSASTSATTATTQAGTATTQAGIATAQATSASASAVSAASSAASAAALLDNFDDHYLGPKASDPTVDNDGNALTGGALYSNTTTKRMRIYFTAYGWVDASSASVATLVTYEYVATAGQTTFSGNDANGVSLSYTVGAEVVIANGAKLKRGTDYTASTGSTIVLVEGLGIGQELSVLAFGNFSVADTYLKSEADARFVNATGDTMTGDLTVSKAGAYLRANRTNSTTEAGVSLGTNNAIEWYMLLLANQAKKNLTFYNSKGSVMQLHEDGYVTKPFQPAFNATRQGGNQSATTLIFDAEDFDEGGVYNHTTGVFMAPIAGKYFFSVYALNTTGTSYMSGVFKKNGASYRSFEGAAQTGYDSWGATIIMSLAAGDTVSVVTSSGGLYGSGYCNFSGHLIG